MVSEATDSCCSPSLRSSALTIFEGLWGDSDRRSSKCFEQSDGAVELTSDIDAMN